MTDRFLSLQARSIRDLISTELWATSAIRIDVEHPFTLVSGKRSPIYIDCRRLISSIIFREMFVLASRILLSAQEVTFDVVAGGETAGIPFAAFLCDAFRVPMVYVRKESKAHGLASRIEGILPAGATVLLVEDLITDAGSKLSFIQAIHEAQATLTDVLVVFDRLQGGRQALAEKGITLHALSDMDSVLHLGGALQILSPTALAAVRRYLTAPDTWQTEAPRATS